MRINSELNKEIHFDQYQEVPEMIRLAEKDFDK
jgi:hypothetical protein